MRRCPSWIAERNEEYGGVVPEIASRAHLERILPVIRAALAEAGLKLEDVDAVAVGHRPGLIGALLVGTSAAKALALGLDVPFLGVDHVHAHLVSGLLESEPINGSHPSLPARVATAVSAHNRCKTPRHCCPRRRGWRHLILGTSL